MRHPFQCIAIIPGSRQGLDIVLAACGPRLLALDIASGKLIGEWPSSLTPPSQAQENHDEDRPAKKQKTSNDTLTNTAIIKLAVTQDGKHVVAITDDKILRVFEVRSDGALVELSQRCMPKRPCAIDIVPNSSTILCGDKFGDVYSLPLQTAEDEIREKPSDMPDAKPTTDGNFKVAASNLTVHTKRNLRSLEAQKSQKNFTARKEPLAFEHQFLLGHVSMLTDMKYASHVVGSKRRSYIITADRDEHIRISRGPPQSHVIEGFCLGHEEFVSKICLIPDTELLVSGGGDDWLGVWNWVECKSLDRISLRPLLERSGVPDASGRPIAVSGVWTGHVPEKVVVVAIEKLPVLFVVPVSSLRGSGMGHPNGHTKISIIRLDGNPIDVIWWSDTMIVSQDVRDDSSSRLVVIRFDSSLNAGNPNNDLGAHRSNEDDDTVKVLGNLNNFTGEVVVSDKSLNDMLYSVNNLRKRRDAGADVENTEDIDPAEE